MCSCKDLQHFNAWIWRGFSGLVFFFFCSSLHLLVADDTPTMKISSSLYAQNLKEMVACSFWLCSFCFVLFGTHLEMICCSKAGKFVFAVFDGRHLPS